ncbi:hypothetical protein MFIFM68171_05510 [Madurella fahalii]|uniref:Uncharacterized protein n=1 Tax=Madurella fahalii TaxID=1157608 RepID=A0ABQ0GCL1_9PEZI
MPLGASITEGVDIVAGRSTRAPLVAETGKRMEVVLDYLYSKISNVTIILSTLLPRKDAGNDNVTVTNKDYCDIVQRYARGGEKIVFAEMNNGFLDTNTDYYDNLYPNEKGAAKMAAVGDQAILVAEQKGVLSEPADTGVSDFVDSNCDPTKGSGRGPVRTQVG